MQKTIPIAVLAAVSVVGQGGWSTTSTALGASLASAVRSLTAGTGTSLGAVDLSWLAPTTSGTGSITSYRIERQIGAGSFSLVATVGSSVTTYTDTGCGANTSCTYRVAAVTSVGTGAWSLTATATGAALVLHDEAQLTGEGRVHTIAAIVEAAGGRMDHVVKTTVYLADMEDFKAMNAVYAQYFTQDLPARTTIAAKGLPAGARVEIEVVAIGREIGRASCRERV